MRNWNSWPQPGGGAAWETDQADGEADGEVCPVFSFSTFYFDFDFSTFSTRMTQNKDEAFFIQYPCQVSSEEEQEKPGNFIQGKPRMSLVRQKYNPLGKNFQKNNMNFDNLCFSGSQLQTHLEIESQPFSTIHGCEQIMQCCCCCCCCC